MQEDKIIKNIRRFMFFYLGGVVLFVVSIWIFGNVYLDNSNADATIYFPIEQNQGVWQIASSLESNKIINSKLAFVAYSLFSGNFSEFKPGIYRLADNIKMGEMVKIFTQGPKEKSVTFYPGMTLREMDKRLSENGFINNGELVKLKVDEFKEKFNFLSDAKSLEGYLMPDTYYFYTKSSAKSIVNTMLENFENKTKDLFSDNDDVNKLIIIASLIEKEVIDEIDKKLVSSVIYNRLKINMALQIDASVIYGKCEGIFAGCSVTRDDFKKDNAFNTYTRRGLPYAPISNPTVSSIRAAIYPEKTNYIYYLSDIDTGETFFSKTFDEHDSKKASIGI